MDVKEKRPREGIFWAIAIALLVLWLAGLLTHIGGPLVHILVIAALVMIIYRLVKGKRIP